MTCGVYLAQLNGNGGIISIGNNSKDLGNWFWSISQLQQQSLRLPEELSYENEYDHQAGRWSSGTSKEETNCMSGRSGYRGVIRSGIPNISPVIRTSRQTWIHNNILIRDMLDCWCKGTKGFPNQPWRWPIHTINGWIRTYLWNQEAANSSTFKHDKYEASISCAP